MEQAELTRFMSPKGYYPDNVVCERDRAAKERTVLQTLLGRSAYFLVHWQCEFLHEMV